MASTGLFLEKVKAPLSNEILSLFEKVRVAYLSAKEDKKEYGGRWRNALDEIKDAFNSLSPLGKEIKVYVGEHHLEDEDAGDPESQTAKHIYEGIKQMRFGSDNVSDPFSKRFKGNVLESLLSDVGLFAKFIHYAIRTGDDALSADCYASVELQADEITEDLEGLDLALEDIPLFIIEHYGDDKDSKKVEAQFKKGLDLLKRAFLHKYSEEDWDELVGVEIKKATEKAETHFLVPNKPMYRIFDIEDMEELRGFSGEYAVQEKYDGMRIQLHKIDNNVKIFSYNEKDITEKCSAQVKELQKKEYGDCILDGELILFDGDTALHRADTISHVFKDQYPDATLRIHVFDIMRHEDRNLTDEPLKERLAILFNNYSAKSSETLAFPSKKDTRTADNLKDVAEYAKEIMEMPTAEGVVIKDMESTYFIGTKKNPKWVKWKKFVDLDLIVLDVKKTKSNLYSYTLGAGPTDEEGKGIVPLKVDGTNTFFMNVGKALNTKIKADVGDIIRVKVDEVKANDVGFKLYSAKVIEIPEVETPDKIITLAMLAKETKPTLKYRVEALKKGIMISDDVHGSATLIAKDMDGFVIYGFEENNLMSKNALRNLDVWKKEAEEAMKTLQGKMSISIINFLKEKGPKGVKELHNFLVKVHGSDYETLLESNYRELKDWAERRDGISFINGKFVADDDKIVKEEKYGEFKLYSRDDDNLDFVVRYNDKTLVWLIDMISDDDIFSLFGKAKKFPAQISTQLGKGRVIDSGKVKIGVQKHGYHEYILEGNKFETKIHFRVVPVDDKPMWLTWTGYKQEPVDSSADEGIWDIYTDKNKGILIPNNQ